MALLTPEDVANKYNVSLSSLKTNFPRTQATIAKKYGIQLEKIGRGKNAAYQIIDFNHVDPDRALTLYESLETNLIPTTIAAKLLDISFLVFIGIVSSPQRSFRGSYTDLLKYLELDVTVENIDIMRIILNQLQDNDYIMYMEDKSDPMYFMAAVQRKTETDMDLEIKAILYFKKIVENTKKSWIPLMKTYLALHVLPQPCTVKQLTEATGLTEYKIRNCLSILSENNIIHRTKEFISDIESDFVVCIGTTIDINAFGV